MANQSSKTRQTRHSCLETGFCEFFSTLALSGLAEALGLLQQINLEVGCSAVFHLNGMHIPTAFELPICSIIDGLS